MATIIKTLLVLLWGSFLVCFSLLGLLWSIQLGTFLSFLSVLAAVAAGVCLPLWLLRRKHPSGRRFRRATGVFFALALLISLGSVLMGDNRYETVREPLLDWEKFQPFTPDNGLVQAAPDAAFRFAGEPPRMSGASGSRRRTAHSTLSLREKS